MRSWLSVALVAALAVTTAVASQEADRSGTTVVAGYERIRASVDAAPEAGLVLLGELNCLSCHVASAAVAAGVDTKPAPDLRGIGARATQPWIREFLLDPQGVKAGTTMPALFGGVDESVRVQLAGDLAQFLVQQSPEAAPPPYEAFRFREAVERGRDLFQNVGCAACHTPEGETPDLADVPLPELAAKGYVATLAEFLGDPGAVRFASRMPDLHLEPAEAEDLAVYLLRDQEPVRPTFRPGFEFEYYLHPPEETGFELDTSIDLDDFRPDRVGVVERLSLWNDVTLQRANHSVRFSGLVELREAGTRQFTVVADRQARVVVRVAGDVVATKEHGSLRTTTADADLPAGRLPITVEYHLGDPDDPARLAVAMGTPAGGAQELGRWVFHEAVQLHPEGVESGIDPAAVARGRMAFAQLGCASCHALSSAPTAIAADLPAPPLAQLRGTTPEWRHGAGAPAYALDDAQRAALADAIDTTVSGRALEPPARILTALATYNCLACHERSEGDFTIGGPSDARRTHFRIVGDQDLGDEGRFPPALTEVGAKLTRDAIVSVLREDRLHIRRDYMHTRMPRFGGPVVASLADDLAAWDFATGASASGGVDLELVEAGRQLIGSDGLRCIACHDVGSGRTYGISVANLGLAHERLRPEWLDRFLRDPGAINSGTRMPQYWVDGDVILDDVAGGTVQGQIAAIWSYLSLGSSMPLPEGMDLGSSLVLAPQSEPIVFRTFMQDASPRAITVGHPEGVHGAFDANVQRLVKLWRGEFFDAKGTWSGRAGQFFGPAGDDVLDMPPGPAVAVLDSIESPWPQAALTDRDVGGEFRGYRYDAERRPTFEYVLNETLITEALVPVVSAGGANVIRRFSIETTSASAPYYLLAAEGREIVADGDSRWRIDSRWFVTVRGDDSLQPFVRNSQGAWQLLVPIPAGSARPIVIDLEIEW